jgi:hypothetical protein
MCMCPHQGIRFAFLSSYFTKAYSHHIYCKVKKRIQGENQVIQSDQDVHMYGCDGYGKVDTRPGMGARY